MTDPRLENHPVIRLATCGAALVGSVTLGLLTKVRHDVRHADVAPIAPTEALVVERSCRACGWELDRPGRVGGVPMRAICDCCAAESGVDDVTLRQARDYRRQWIEHGAEWFDPTFRPARWDLYTQLSSLAAA
jgi:hypothetical protein